MNIAKVLLMAGLSAVNPLLGMFGAVVSLIVDDSVKGVQALASAAANIVCPFGVGSVARALWGFASEATIETAFGLIDPSGRPATTRCHYCEEREAMRILDSRGNRVCETCFRRMAGVVCLSDGGGSVAGALLGEHRAIILNENLLLGSRRFNARTFTADVGTGQIRNKHLSLGEIQKGSLRIGKIKGPE